MTYTSEIFGDRLRRVREAKEMSVEHAENILHGNGIPLTAERLREIENGSTVTAFEFWGLSRLYGVIFEELCFDFDERKYRRL